MELSLAHTRILSSEMAHLQYVPHLRRLALTGLRIKSSDLHHLQGTEIPCGSVNHTIDVEFAHELLLYASFLLRHASDDSGATPWVHIDTFLETRRIAATDSASSAGSPVNG